jgi:hypothetical protein
MSDRRAELKARADLCKKQALVAMELADKATSDERRAEYLRLAVEWLKLSSEIHEFGDFLQEAFRASGQPV